jgi:hypothetical protein
VTLLLWAVIFVLTASEIFVRDRNDRQRAAAEQNSSILLKEWLSPVQLSQYGSNGCFEVRRSLSGIRHRIRNDDQSNIDQLDEDGRRVAACSDRKVNFPSATSCLQRNSHLRATSRRRST